VCYVIRYPVRRSDFAVLAHSPFWGAFSHTDTIRITQRNMLEPTRCRRHTGTSLEGKPELHGADIRRRGGSDNFQEPTNT
jgi:hypothetical protein